MVYTLEVYRELNRYKYPPFYFTSKNQTKFTQNQKEKLKYAIDLLSK